MSTLLARSEKALCLAILLILTLINVRGVKDTGSAFLIPTYLFVGTLLLVIIVGAVRVFAAGGHPVPIVAPPRLPVSASMLSNWLLKCPIVLATRQHRPCDPCQLVGCRDDEHVAWGSASG
jgi:amino acid transporter